MATKVEALRSWNQELRAKRRVLGILQERRVGVLLATDPALRILIAWNLNYPGNYFRLVPFRDFGDLQHLSPGKHAINAFDMRTCDTDPRLVAVMLPRCHHCVLTENDEGLPDILRKKVMQAAKEQPI